jgi:peroxiredoxin
MGFSVFRSAPAAQDFDMRKLDGSPLHLADLKGRVVLMNFWRRNCRYCRQEKKHLRTMMKKVQSDDLTVLCVNLWDTPRWVKSYAGKGAPDFLYATRGRRGGCFVKNEVRGKLMGYFVINGANEAVYEVKGFPTTYVIDKDGKVVAGHLGMARWDNPTVSGWISRLIGHVSRIVSRPGLSVIRNRDRDALPPWLDGLLAGPVAQSSTSAGAGR